MFKEFIPKWIENGFASWPAAKHRFILYRWQVWTFFQRCKETSQRNNHSGSLQAAGRPHIPTKTHTISFFIVLNELQIRCHSLKETGPSHSPGRSPPHLHLQDTGSGSHHQVQLSSQPIGQCPCSSRRPTANQRAPPRLTSGSKRLRKAAPPSWKGARQTSLALQNHFLSTHFSPCSPLNVSALEYPAPAVLIPRLSQHASVVRPDPI